MKDHRVLSRIMPPVISISTLVFSLSSCGGPAPAESPTPPDTSEVIDATPTTILSIAGGNVLVMKPGDTAWISGEEGMTLEVDYKIKTEAGSHATITFFEGSTIELESGTEISLNDLDIDGTESHIGIGQSLGKTVSRVKKLVDPASSYEIETPAAIAAVRGTILGVDVDEEGNTDVSNLEGLVSVTGGGEEVILAEGTHTTVTPGGSPGEPEPNVTPSPTPTQWRGSPTPTTPTPTPVPSPTVIIGITKTSDHQTAFPGDNITYTYLVNNEGNVPLSDVAVIDDKTGQPEYVSGDNDANGSLDTGETWTFDAVYTVKDDEVGQLTNRAFATGSSPDGDEVYASASATVAINDIVVQITSLIPDQIVSQNVTVSGTVNDLSITSAILSVNGAPTNISVENGQFSASVTLSYGTNTITVTVTKYPDITRSATVILEPATPPPTEPM